MSSVRKLLILLCVVLCAPSFLRAATTATVTITGGEQYLASAGAFDEGTVEISINGYARSVVYAQPSTTASIAAALAGTFSVDCNSPAGAVASGATITFYLKNGASLTQLSMSSESIEGQQSSFGASYGADSSPAGAPVIMDMSPTEGIVGTKITLTGSNFGSAAGTIRLNGVTASASVWNSTSIVLTVPSGATTGAITIATAAGDASSGIFTLLDTTTSTDVYSFSVPSGGYAGNGNLLGYTDSVTGTWTGSYDDLNRLESATVTPSFNGYQYYCWAYDSFGNRSAQDSATQAFSAANGLTCTPPSGGSIATDITTPATNNRIASTNANGVAWTVGYDNAGNILSDGRNTYLYDGEGRICAMQTPSMTGGGATMVQYIYNADGVRVAKGSISSWSCDVRSNGFTATNSYAIGPSGEQITETDGSNNWVHTNVNAPGGILATYDPSGLHFQISDWLGSRRVQTNYAGVPEMYFGNLPFGDQLTETAATNCTASIYCFSEDSTEHHFTGKERDAESGNDYFGARYFGSSMGRFLSPDPDIRQPVQSCASGY